MATCEVCGNDYWMAFEVRTVSGDVHTFDCFECAAHRLAPICEHCQVKIVGHGVEVSGRFFCCAHCARQEEGDRGAEIRDAVGARPR
ncbi:Prokaryotic metallothionein [Micromonospora sp. NPDC020750]|uniref:Prokaryotic metallothionein n=1 Tax=Micromonospora TaxID=1873 RepID=UPI001376FDFA|nr:Prokaryotic metallothionein [Micromonospora rubida]NBE84988.1 Prokaryotic metallothionein [Micromonospora rubida]